MGKCVGILSNARTIRWKRSNRPTGKQRGLSRAFKTQSNELLASKHAQGGTAPEVGIWSSGGMPQRWHLLDQRRFWLVFSSHIDKYFPTFVPRAVFYGSSRTPSRNSQNKTKVQLKIVRTRSLCNTGDGTGGRDRVHSRDLENLRQAHI